MQVPPERRVPRFEGFSERQALVLKRAVGVFGLTFGVAAGAVASELLPFHINLNLGNFFFDNLSTSSIVGGILGTLAGYKGAGAAVNYYNRIGDPDKTIRMR